MAFIAPSLVGIKDLPRRAPLSTPRILPTISPLPASRHHQRRATPILAQTPSPTSPAPTAADTPSPPSPFACPVCRAPITLALPSCPSCATPFPRLSRYGNVVDLAPSLPISTPTLFQSPKLATFRNPLVSSIYDLGWRAGFRNSGFPGVDAEARLFTEFLRALKLPADSPRIVLDLSCGTAPASRAIAAMRNASPGAWTPLVGSWIAADGSESMVREAATKRARKDDYEVVRADCAALPIRDGALAAVHAGAAVHCWARLQDGLGEVRRVLEPGGGFFATTFLKGAMGTGGAMLRANQAPFRFFEKDELFYLFKAAGFSEVEVEVIRNCAIVRAIK